MFHLQRFHHVVVVGCGADDGRLRDDFATVPSLLVFEIMLNDVVVTTNRPMMHHSATSAWGSSQTTYYDDDGRTYLVAMQRFP